MSAISHRYIDVLVSRVVKYIKAMEQIDYLTKEVLF